MIGGPPGLGVAAAPRCCSCAGAPAGEPNWLLGLTAAPAAVALRQVLA